jgi:hypothetical protein
MTHGPMHGSKMSEQKPILSYATRIDDSAVIIEGDESRFRVSFAPRPQLETALKAFSLIVAAIVVIPLTILGGAKDILNSPEVGAALLIAGMFLIGAWQMWRRRRVRTEFRVGEGMLRITSPHFRRIYREFPLQEGLFFRVAGYGIALSNLRPLGLLWLDSPGERSILFFGNEGFDLKRLSNIVNTLNSAIADPKYQSIKSEAFPPPPDAP